MKNETELKKRAMDLVSTSVDDLHSSLPYLKSEIEDDIQVVEFGYQICNRRGEKTKAKMLGAKLRNMKKEVLHERYLRLLAKAWD
jgi:hypothetical protein